ncbi:SOS response-associated peptidase family protein [Maritalea myrionectae]|uniref:SOS response-associated peptidase family protein n=1 Tax=Maritalea myrionectae TaxID=454601 RepID=UPI002482C2FB|nr:SOS response-associated peptidase family protein [Maritalea myrionectae]
MEIPRGGSQCSALRIAVLTTELNKVVGEVHPKAMPVILNNDYERDTWLNASWEEAQELQRPFKDRELEIVAIGEPRDELNKL